MGARELPLLELFLRYCRKHAETWPNLRPLSFDGFADAWKMNSRAFHELVLSSDLEFD